MGFGENKMDVLHAFNGIKSRPEYQCRTALGVKDRFGVSILLNALSPLDELVIENEEFIKRLTGEEQVDMLGIYFKNMYPGKWEPIGGKALDAIMTILHREKAFDLMKLALDKRILLEREVLIYFLKHRKEFLEAIKSGILEHVDIMTPVLVGKGILHVLIESGEEVLCEKILNNLTADREEKIKYDHFTKIEGNSILHSAVISNNLKLIGRVTRDFNRLCGHQNKFGMSPLKLALANGNTFESIKVLLEHGCFADGEIILKEEFIVDFDNFEENLGLKKFEKFALKSNLDLEKIFTDARNLSNLNPLKSCYYFMGLLTSCREHISSFDRIFSSDLIGSPRLNRNRSLSNETFKRSPSLWSILSNENFNENDFIMETAFPVYKIVEGLNFNFCSDEVKSRVLKNLSKIETLDFSGVVLTRFIKILVEFSEPSVFAHFLNRDIEFYFCIRSLFKQFKEDYNKIIPFLNVIGFKADEPFVDGFYPIHLAVQTDNFTLMNFLINNYNIDLRIKTIYEGNNILHYGLSDRTSLEMKNYLLRVVPDLLLSDNNFNVTPLQVSLMKTENYDNVNRILEVYQKTFHRYEFDYSMEVQEIYQEILSNWPKSPGTDNHAKTKFGMMFETAGSDEVARLLLNFLSKKLLRHFVDEKGTSIKKYLRNLDNRHDKSPSTVAIDYSP